MHLFVLIVDKPENLDKVVEAFRKIGITGATIFDTIGLGHTSLYGGAMPKAIASLHRIFDRDQKIYNHTLMSVIKTQESLDEAFRVAEEVCGDFNKPDVGIMFSIKLDKVVGYNTPEMRAEQD